MKYFYFLVSTFLIFSCQTNTEKTDGAIVSDSTQIINQNNIKEAGLWLKTAIEDFFNQNRTDIIEICTSEYDQYKTDAINVDYDGGLSVEEFQKKWSGKYNTTLDQIGKSFLLSGQDNGRIKVLKCEPISDSLLTFYTEIQDLDFKILHKKNITVVKTEKGFKIDNIIDIEEK